MNRTLHVSSGAGRGHTLNARIFLVKLIPSAELVLLKARNVHLVFLEECSECVVHFYGILEFGCAEL
jgi:hypothetical protein